MPILAVFLLVLAVVLLWLAGRRQKASGLPAGRIIYTDTRAWGPVEEPLYAADLGLTGRPDYLVQRDNQVIPVEVKSGRAAEAPYDSHIYQLAAYCLLVQRVYGKRPAYGILRYANRTFAIDYTPQLEASLLALLDEIRVQERRKEVARSHESAARCKGCGYRSICDQRLD
ncbi:MAG TPA: CRISPR-associated protein Cas4 [Anaerolineales bacterium]